MVKVSILFFGCIRIHLQFFFWLENNYHTSYCTIIVRILSCWLKSCFENMISVIIMKLSFQNTISQQVFIECVIRNV